MPIRPANELMAIFELKTKHRRRQRFNDRRGHNQETLILPRRRSGWGLLQFADDDPGASPKFIATMQWAQKLGQAVTVP